MTVTLDVTGGDVHAFDDAGERTYADLLDEVGLNPHEVAVLVDGRPVPADETATDSARVVRLVKGG
ncbi:MAG: ubiquitin-like small modifier protein 2 [Halobacteriaceae archaeon]